MTEKRILEKKRLEYLNSERASLLGSKRLLNKTNHVEKSRFLDKFKAFDTDDTFYARTGNFLFTI